MAQHPISKSKLADRVVRTLNAGKVLVENRVTSRDAMLAVAHARDQAILEAFMQRKAIGEHSMPFDFLTESVVTAENVEGKNYRLAKLPARGLSLLSHNQGIFLVALDNDPSQEIYPVTNSHLTMYAGQPALAMEGEMYYIPFHDTLKVYGLEKDCSLIVQFVKAGEYFTEDEFFCISPSMQDDVVRRAVEMLSAQLGQEDTFTDAKNP